MGLGCNIRIDPSQHRACRCSVRHVLVLSFVSALLFRLIRRYSDSDVLAFALTVLAICGSIVHWLARPHLVSWLFVLIFSHVILSAEEGKTGGLYALPALMCIWVNLHGGFLWVSCCWLLLP